MEQQKSNSMLLRSPILHPLLLAVYPVLFLFAENIDITEAKHLALPLGCVVAACIVIWLLLAAVVKDRHARALVVSLILFCFFIYGHLYAPLDAFLIEREATITAAMEDVHGLRQDLHILLSLVFFAMITLVCSRMARAKSSPERATEIINVMAAVLLLMPLFKIGSYLASHSPGETTAIASTATTSDAPDIYYIILDGYGRADVLQKHYQFDNSEFIDFLTNQGFFVAQRGHTNYFWTYLSLSSSLNMEYVTYLSEFADKGTLDRTRAFRMIQNSKVAQYLKKKGYRHVHFSSTWGPTMDNPHADQQIACSAGVFRVEFYRVLVESTWLRIWSRLVHADLAQCYLEVFDKLASSSNIPGPKFVFSHFVLPHHPYLFDRQGNILKHATVANQFDFQNKLWALKDKYIDQLIFLNSQLERIINSILKQSSTPPIIIVQSDHGPALTDVELEIAQQARFANFAAFHLPNQANNLFPDNPTPVNNFRRIFNAYFSANFELLPAQHYYSAFNDPFKFSPYQLTTDESEQENEE